MDRAFGDYKVIEKIAQGAMGEIFLVEKESKNYALKIVKNSEVEKDSERFLRFKREIELSSELDNSNIVKVHDHQLSGETPFMVMEYMKNGSLEDRLKREKTLVPLEVLKIAMEIANALKAMHTKSITHRDIKPGNILIAEDGSYKLTDLGLAGLSSEARHSGNENLTMSQTALGTPYYISPEQARNAQSVDIRADIYSLGATLYQCLTGQRVYEGTSGIDVMMKHVNEPVKSPRDINGELPENLTSVILKMLEKDPNNRYTSPDSLLNDLNKIKDYDAPPEDLIASHMSLTIPRKKNRTGMFMFLALAGIIIVAGFAFYKSSFSPPDKTDHFYKKDRTEVKLIKAVASSEFLTLKAAAVEKFLKTYPTEADKEKMLLAVQTAKTLAQTQTYHLTVKKAGNLKEARAFAFRLYLDDKKVYDYESEGQRKYIYPNSRVVFNWKPGTKIILELEEFDWKNEIMYRASLTDFFSIRGLSGDKRYKVKEADKRFFQNGVVSVEYGIEEVSEEGFEAFEDYIFPGNKW